MPSRIVRDSRHTPHFIRWRRPLSPLSIVSLAAVLFLWGGGFHEWIAFRRVESLIAARRYDSAGSLIFWIQWTGLSEGELSFWKGRLLRKQIRGIESLECLTAARKGGFDSDRVHRELILLHAQGGNLSPILSELERMLSKPGRDAGEICEAFVNGALVDGRTEVALTIIPVWQQEFPNDPQPHYMLGRLYEHKLDTSAAENEYRLALQRDSRHWPSRYGLGRLLLAQRKASEAMVQFRSASRMRDNAAPRLQVARCLRALGRIDEARSILLELSSHSSDDLANSFVHVGEQASGLPVEMELGLLESSVQNWSAALPWLESVVKHDPQALDARYSLAVTLRSLGRHEEAKREFAEVKRVREAIAEADRLVDYVAHNKEHCVAERCRIGELFLKNEDRRRGEFWLRDALNRDPNFVPAHQLLAEYYEDLARHNPVYAESASRHRLAAAKPHEKRRDSLPQSKQQNP